MTQHAATPPRRRLIASAGAVGALAVAATLGGCAGVPSAGRARVVVVGGGWGGATAARYLRLWADALDVTLVEREAQFVSCPLSNLVLGGFRRIDEVSRSYGGLEAIGVRRLRAEVLAIDAAARRVQLANGDTLAYDRLVLSPGVDFLWDEVIGLRAAVADGSVSHAWKAGAQTLALRRQIEAMPDGGVFALCIPAVPYRCPPGPYERACLVAAYLKRAKPRAKLLVLDANPEVQSKKALFERAWREHYAGIIEYRPNTELKEVSMRGGRLLAKTEFDDVAADVLNAIPPQRAGDIAARTGLLNINRRWAGVNWLTMESTVAGGVHVLGDACFPAPAMPKSGHMANQHAKVAAAAIIALLDGQAPNPTPVMTNTCYSYVTPDEAVHVASVHQYDAAEHTFKPVPGAGGLSRAASTLEAQHAAAWARNIWADVLGP